MTTRIHPAHLTHDDSTASVVQNPTTTLSDDVAATKLVLDAQDRPVILDIAAFAPSEGESVDALIKNPPPGAPVPPILAPRDGRLFLDREKFHTAFAGDLDAEEAAFMADSQVPWGVEALRGRVTKAAWRSKPSWYLVSTEDRMIPPAAQRIMAKRAGARTVEQKGSHSIYVSQPGAVVAIIDQAVSGVRAAGQAEAAEPGASPRA